MSQEQNPTPDPSDGSSAEIASEPHEYVMIIDNLSINHVDLKCSTCKDLTSHEWVKVYPHEQDMDPMKQLDMTKRLKMCTNCGKFTTGD